MRSLCLSLGLLAATGCSTVPPAPVLQTAAPAFGRIVDLTAESSATVYRIKLPDGSQRSARSAQPFPIGACVELAETRVRESTQCH